MSKPRVAILTGRSDPARTGLPAQQKEFLTATTPPTAEAIFDGVPWSGGAPERPVPLALAAWRNARQWRAAYTPAARRAMAERLKTLRQGPLTIITGSCGLNMLQAAWFEGACDLVIALGPVTATRPDLKGARLVTVAGQNDILSLAMHRVPPDIRVSCGHMGYWTCAETRSAVSGLLIEWAS